MIKSAFSRQYFCRDEKNFLQKKRIRNKSSFVKTTFLKQTYKILDDPISSLITSRTV